jgi:hypothetical protein
LPEDIRDLKYSDKTLDADKVNIYIYSDQYKGPRMPAGNGITEKPPVRMSQDGKTFFKGGEGRFDKQ